MTVELSVTQVREALHQRRARDDDGGPRSSLFLGRLFHEVMAALLDPAAQHELLRDGYEDPKKLIQQVYRTRIGPRLSRDAAALQACSSDVLAFWEATEALVSWLCELVTTARKQGVPEGELAALLKPELAVERVLEHPSWREPVRLRGQIDVLIQVPGGAYCVTELKTGRGSAEADLAQACLYKMILGGKGSLALVRFSPTRSELVLDEAALGPGQKTLLDLVGTLAGVRSSGAPQSVGAQSPAAQTSSTDLTALGRRITETFREYGVDITLGSPTTGPTFVRFPAVLGRRQQVSRLHQNADNVQVRLGLSAPPMIIVERGKLMIDVQRPDRQVVPFGAVVAQIRQHDEPKGGALMPVGVDLAGTVRFANLGDALNCHMLVAGTTGSGKSEWLRFALAGLAARYSPEQVQFLLIDPKRNAFLELRNSPYVYGSRGIIFPDTHSVLDVLSELLEEMESRYRKFSEVMADDLAQYVAKTGEKLPRIVVVCDEYYDLIMRSKQDKNGVEESVSRLGSKARAAGIHLILATQQPSRAVIRGTLDANMPARVGLRTDKAIESTMLLGSSGAESLLGHGDLLFRDVGSPVRLQAPLTRSEDRAGLFAARSQG